MHASPERHLEVAFGRLRNQPLTAAVVLREGPRWCDPRLLRRIRSGRAPLLAMRSPAEEDSLLAMRSPAEDANKEGPRLLVLTSLA